MIKILISLSFILLSFISQAEFYSHCTLFAENGEKFTVFLNGEKKNDEASERVRMINLTQSYYSIKIVFEDATIPNIERKIFNVQNADGAPVDVTYVLKRNKKAEMGLYWKSQTAYPGYIETNKPTVVVVNGGNQVVQQTTTTTIEPVKSGVSVNIGGLGGSVSFNTGANTNTTSTEQTTTTVISTTPPTTTNLPCSGNILGEQDYNSAISSIKARTTTEGKMLSAKQIISNNCLSVAQLKTIVKLFEFEESRLELSKYAYSYTIDKGNYYKLNDIFTSESSIDELNKAILK